MSKKESPRARLNRLLLMNFNQNERTALTVIRSLNDNYRVLESLIGYEFEKALKATSLSQVITKNEAIKLAKDWEAVLKENPQLLEISNKTLNTYRLTVQEAFKYSIETHLTDLTLKNQALVSEALTTAYYKNLGLIAYQIQEAAGVYQEIQNPHHAAQIINRVWVGTENFIDRFSKDKTKTLQALDVLLKDGFINNRSPQEMTRLYQKALKASELNARRLVLTETAHIFAEATADAYAFNEVEEYEILATLDNRTSSICQELDGQRFKVSEKRVGVNYPPFHPCCRTTTVPVIPSWNRSGKRWSKDADGIRHKVDNMTYKEWEKTYLNPGIK